MPQNDDPKHWDTLDRDLGRFSRIERATSYVSRPMIAPGIALAFIILAALGAALFFGQSSNSMIVVAAAGFGAYMAINIGANDVANNMGPAVGANALTMGGAIAMPRFLKALAPFWQAATWFRPFRKASLILLALQKRASLSGR